MNDSYDVIIIGGGLAGLTLAIQLAESKRRVLVAEKNKYPFHRVCGEYISMESWDFLTRIGLPLSELNLPRITQLKASSVRGNMLTHSLKPGGLGISRYKLDAALAGVARSRGIAILEECRIEDVQKESDTFLVSSHQKKFACSVVIGAFGKRSNIDKKLERTFINSPRKPSENWVGVKYHVKADIVPNVIELHNFDNGYCGISRIEDDKCCLCYLTKADNLRKFDGNIEKMEKHLLSSNPFLKDYFRNRGNFLFDSPQTISQVCFENKQPVEKNVLMIGDSAGLIAPLCGNGMSMAFQASAVCFPILEKFLSGLISRDQMEMEYTIRWKRLFGTRLKIGRMLQPLLVKSYLSKPAIATLKYTPFIMKQIIRLTHGKPF